MDTARVDISYRPLRIAWAISDGDMTAFRAAVRFSYALWGGRYNPIVTVEREEQAALIVDAFKADVIYSIGDSPRVKDFPNRFPHLITPWYSDEIFVDEGAGGKRSCLLDIHNLCVQARDTAEWRILKEKGVWLWDWKADDPLAEILLIQLGAYPDANEIGIEYRSIVKRATGATEATIDQELEIPIETLGYPSIASLSRYRLGTSL
jgi:hypothetical protein